ncbi:ABC transporter ATP-binding protein [Synoicihabitans lomoniglobus]|uniref:ATP-binding cassette domain-containing protein n=1 Tax=Synoicihabitans lomoniglobus TaxID=2909285 RepID=A0AAF0I6Z5_9BACT|nr:ATP-binding cassette domain-containing protein [Opitutaceae bacterium LMO-M01]WED66391.1 ATP-binding cassette domain-containing protein [Opitutaceae bacterium LMO-M01]
MPTEPESTPLLNVSRLNVARGTKRLLRDLTWSIQPGEHWVVMGPNGCGKTTLLRSLTGFIAPSSGDITLLGAVYGETDWREVRQSVGLVSSSLQPHIPGGEIALETVISGRYDQLDFWGESTAADERAALALLRKLHVGAIARREWAYLSQGERQRVLIARALAARPRLLILDEPCAGLDPVARAEFLAAMNGLTDDVHGPAVLLVTHHVEEITTGFTHAMLMAKGQSVAAGPLRETLNNTNLSTAFAAPLRIRRTAKGWHLTSVSG